MHGATGYRDLGADDIDRLRSVSSWQSGFCRCGQARGTGSRLVVLQRHRLALAAHGAVEVQLAESRGRKGADHHLGLFHRLLGGEALPGVGAEVVAAEDDALDWEAVLGGDPLDEVAEV